MRQQAVALLPLEAIWSGHIVAKASSPGLDRSPDEVRPPLTVDPPPQKAPSCDEQGARDEWGPYLDDVDPHAAAYLWLQVLLRAVHDACGNCPDLMHRPNRRLHTARTAWAWLYSRSFDIKSDRHEVCQMAGVDPDRFDRAMATANIPRPTETGLQNAFLTFETAIWRMKGCNGPQPRPFGDGAMATPHKATFNSVSLRKSGRKNPARTMRAA